jgi:hypothetical protein
VACRATAAERDALQQTFARLGAVRSPSGDEPTEEAASAAE